MERTPVQSSLIESIAYDADKAVLDIWFTAGTHYRYYDVEPETVQEFLEAPSKGHYFNEYIRDGYLFDLRYG